MDQDKFNDFFIDLSHFSLNQNKDSIYESDSV
jgi:hypothetical protein